MARAAMEQLEERLDGVGVVRTRRSEALEPVPRLLVELDRKRGLGDDDTTSGAMLG